MNETVFVIGELNVDLIASGKDVMPEWNREKIIDDFKIELGSSSAITASGLAGLGLNVYFISVVGDDYFGHHCINQLKKVGVNTSYVKVDPSIQTGVTISLSTEVDRAFLTYMGAIPKVNPNHLPDELMNKASHIHFGSYYLQDDMRSHWYSIFKEARKNGISTSFDMGWDPRDSWNREQVIQLLDYTDLFIPSEDELLQLLGYKNLTPEALDNFTHKPGLIAIKRGKHGSLLLDENKDQHELPAYDVTPIDTTGAGDSFNAGLIYSYLKDKIGSNLLEFANACGALATQRIGGASSVPSVEEVHNFIEEHK